MSLLLQKHHNAIKKMLTIFKQYLLAETRYMFVLYSVHFMDSDYGQA